MAQILSQLPVSFEHVQDALLMLPKLSYSHVVECLRVLSYDARFGRLVLSLQLAGQGFVLQTILVVEDLISDVAVAVLRPFSLLPEGHAEVTPLHLIIQD